MGFAAQRLCHVAIGAHLPRCNGPREGVDALMEPRQARHVQPHLAQIQRLALQQRLDALDGRRRFGRRPRSIARAAEAQQSGHGGGIVHLGQLHGTQARSAPGQPAAA